MAPYKLLAISKKEYDFLTDILKTKEPGEFAEGEHDDAFYSIAKKLNVEP